MRTSTLLRLALTFVIALQSPVALATASLQAAAKPSCCGATCKCARCDESSCSRDRHDAGGCAMETSPCHRQAPGVIAAAESYLRAPDVVLDRLPERVVLSGDSQRAPSSEPDAPNPPPPRA